MQPGNEIWSVLELKMKNIFLKKHGENEVEKLISDIFVKNQN